MVQVRFPAGLGLAIGVALATAATARSPSVRAAFGALQLETLQGAPIPSGANAGPTILAFWRADCAPCLIELRDARDYAAAARPAKLLFVGLQDSAALRREAAKAGAPSGLVAHGIGAPEMILTAFGAVPPRLPLAVALDRSGRVCARHIGLLGTDRVRDWARTCGSAHAHG